MADDTQFSRGPERSPFGPLDATIEVRIPAIVVERLRQVGALGGMDLSELVRENLYVLAYGLEHVLSVRQSRVLHASGNVGQQLNKVTTTLDWGDGT